MDASTNGPKQSPQHAPALKLTLTSLLIAALTLSGGCEFDSYMDPSKAGRWEPTPITLPILKRIALIEEEDDFIIGLRQPNAKDLIPEVKEYVIGPGDLVTVDILGLTQPGVPAIITRRIDELGRMRLPVVGEIKVAGLTTKRYEQVLRDILHPEIVVDPTVSVIVQEGRQRTFSILGVNAAGTYTIVENDFRLLDAISLARGIPPAIDKIYVIRHIPLADVYKGDDGEKSGKHFGTPGPEGLDPNETRPGVAPVKGATGGKDPLDPLKAIDKAAGGKKDPKKTDPKKDDKKDDKKDVKPNRSLDDALDGAAKDKGEGQYVNINGKWVWVKSKSASGSKTDGTKGGVDDKDDSAVEDLVTEEVIEIDARALVKGEAKYNIIVRPGDIIRVPQLLGGVVYAAGEVARQGVYALPGQEKLTLKRLVASAGGLNGLAYVERVDITRRIGDQEAVLRINFRAIAEGVHPDIFLKADDHIHFGTNFVMTPLAVFRNGFRASYGFGFLIDRNFGPDVFGPVPTDRNN